MDSITAKKAIIDQVHSDEKYTFESASDNSVCVTVNITDLSFENFNLTTETDRTARTLARHGWGIIRFEIVKRNWVRLWFGNPENF